MRNILIILSMLSCSLLTGCSFIPESVNLNPQVNPAPTANVGQGKQVAVQVIDARPDSSIGGRPSGFGPAANISLGNNITGVVQQNIENGLSDYGFAAVDYAVAPNTPRTLTLCITGLQYDPRVGLLNGDVYLTSTIEGTANNKGHIYDKVYRASNKKIIFITPTSGQDSDNINRVFSDTLNQILADQALMAFLAR
jgi:uncharacterized lipoprotein YajG